MSPPKHITVLGAGLSGLTASYNIIKSLPNTRITLIDSADRAGGWIRSTKHRVKVGGQEGDVWLEGGPRSIRPKGSLGAAGMLKMIVDLGLKDDIIPISKSHPSAKNRFILSPTNKLQKLGLNPINGAIPLSTMLHASVEPFQPTSKSETDDESVHSYLTRRFGKGVAKLASAGMHGIYAASLEDLSAKAILGRVFDWESEYGSVIWGMFRDKKSLKRVMERKDEEGRWAQLGEIGRDREDWAMYGLKGGIGTLTGRLEGFIKDQGGVEVRLGESVRGLKSTPEGVEITTPTGTFETSHIISSIPIPALASLIPSINFPVNPRTTVGVVSLVFPLPPSAIHPNGFGYLIPRPNTSAEKENNPHGILGVVFDSTALPGMDTLTNVTKLTLMFGGPYYTSYLPTIPTPERSEDLVKPALYHLRKTFSSLVGVDPILSQTAIQKDCIPTYKPGHIARTQHLRDQIVNGEWNGRLSLVGNEFKGIGVNNSVWTVEDVVAALAKGEVVTGLEGV